MNKFIVLTLSVLIALLAATLANIMSIQPSGIQEETNQEKVTAIDEIRAGVREANYKLCQGNYEIFLKRMAYLNDAVSHRRVFDADKYMNLSITALANVKDTCVYTIMRDGKS